MFDYLGLLNKFLKDHDAHEAFWKQVDEDNVKKILEREDPTSIIIRSFNWGYDYPWPKLHEKWQDYCQLVITNI